MNTAARKNKFLIVLMVGLLALVLTACGSAYVDALNPAIDEFNNAANGFNAQLDVVNNDNSKFTDPQWVAEAETALAALRGSAQALNNLPEPDSDEYNKLASLVKQLAGATLNAVDAYQAAIESQDVSNISDADPFMDQINTLLPQINAEVGRLSE